MPAYKDTMQDEIKLMARAIVDQYETPTQKNCKFVNTGASGSVSAIVKLNDGYYRFDTSNFIKYKINYCDQCGRSLQ